MLTFTRLSARPLALLILAAVAAALPAQVYLSEAASANVNFRDGDGDTPDWIELANGGAEAVDLTGWSLSDRLDDPRKWSFTETQLDAGAYCLVWASGKDRPDTAAHVPHASFRLSSAGESVYLFDAETALVDSLDLRGTPGYGSVGRDTIGGPRLLYDALTPGAPNAAGFLRQLRGRVRFSRPGGHVTPFALALAPEGVDERHHVRYTLDGSTPTRTSQPYRRPIEITETTVVRASVFADPDARPSDPQTAVYLTGVEHAVDVATLTTDPDHLFDPTDGIYVLGEGYQGEIPYYGANIWSGREVPMHFGFHPRGGGEGLGVDGGARIFGGWSRSHAQRSFAFFARPAYGAERIDYALFPNRDYDSFASVVLRNSGNDWRNTYLRDATLTGLMTGSGVDHADYRPVATYLNGAYWGLYNLREKINEDFLAARHGVDAEAVDLLEADGIALEGSADDYRALNDYVTDADLSGEAAFARVAAEVDLDNLAAYYAAQVYFDNSDWPGNNIKFWRAPGTKWRWILYDTDFGASVWNPEAYRSNTLAFALATDGPDWPNPPWSTLLMRRLLTNETFRHRFINRAADQLNGRFRPDAATALLDGNAARIAPEITAAEARWGEGFPWSRQLDWMRTFFRERPRHLREHYRTQFGLPAEHTLAIEIADTTHGRVRVNSLTVGGPSWSGVYFETVPVRVAACAKTGHAFSHWRHDAMLVDSVLVVDLTSARTLEPVFRAATTSVVEVAPPSPVTDLRAGPHPLGDVLEASLRLSGPGSLTLQLTDALGRVVRQRRLANLPAGEHAHAFDVADLPAGLYRLLARDEVTGGTAGVAVVRY